MRVPLSLALLSVPLLVFAGVLGACGDDEGGGEGTLEEYLLSVESVARQMLEKKATLEEQYPTAFEEVEPTKRLLTGAIPILRDFVERMERIDPPSQAEAAHTSFTEAGREAQQTLEDTSVLLEGVQSEEDLDAAVAAAPSVVAIFTKLQDACLAEQALADRNDVAIDLSCPEDELRP